MITRFLARLAEHAPPRKFLTGNALVLTFSFIVANDFESSVGGSFFAGRHWAALPGRCRGSRANGAGTTRTARRPAGDCHSNRGSVRRGG